MNSYEARVARAVEKALEGRLYGPKYLGQSSKVFDVVLDERDAKEIRHYLDQVFPVAAAT